MKYLLCLVLTVFLVGCPPPTTFYRGKVTEITRFTSITDGEQRVILVIEYENSVMKSTIHLNGAQAATLNASKLKAGDEVVIDGYGRINTVSTHEVAPEK